MHYEYRLILQYTHTLYSPPPPPPPPPPPHPLSLKNTLYNLSLNTHTHTHTQTHTHTAVCEVNDSVCLFDVGFILLININAWH